MGWWEGICSGLCLVLTSSSRDGCERQVALILQICDNRKRMATDPLFAPHIGTDEAVDSLPAGLLPRAQLIRTVRVRTLSDERLWRQIEHEVDTTQGLAGLCGGRMIRKVLVSVLSSCT